MEDRNPRLALGGGWSLMNISLGGFFIVLGFIIGILNGAVSFFAIGDSQNIPIWSNIIAGIAFCLILLGILGFWFVIPAFQKWGKTKPWLAWIFLIIALAVVGLLVIFRNTPI